MGVSSHTLLRIADPENQDQLLSLEEFTGPCLNKMGIYYLRRLSIIGAYCTIYFSIPARLLSLSKQSARAGRWIGISS